MSAPTLSVHDQPLPYVHKLKQRLADAVDLVVIHCTELPDMVTARSCGEKVLYASGTGNSGHDYIDREGNIYRYVPGTRVAHHTQGYNQRSIGIELVNLGRYPNWLDSRHQTMTQPYAAAQIASLHTLLTDLSRNYPNLRCIAGHEDLDTTMVPASNDPSIQVHRKCDPGPQFPWPTILQGTRFERLRR